MLQKKICPLFFVRLIYLHLENKLAYHYSIDPLYNIPKIISPRFKKNSIKITILFDKRLKIKVFLNYYLAPSLYKLINQNRSMLTNR